MLTGSVLLREPQMALGLPGDWSQDSAVIRHRPPNNRGHGMNPTVERGCIPMEQQVLTGPADSIHS
jgi:hypothetical protein